VCRCVGTSPCVCVCCSRVCLFVCVALVCVRAGVTLRGCA